MKPSINFALSACAAALFTTLVSAQPETTEPVGFRTSALRADSDSFVSVPFLRPAGFVGEIQSAVADTITVGGASWAPNQFVYAGASQRNHYYALIGSASGANPKEGHTYPILANGTNSLQVQLSQDDLAGIPANARVSVIPNWTLATVFPATDQNVSFTPTTSSAQYKTQIRVPDPSAAGTNLPYVDYFFSSDVGSVGNVGWRLVGDEVTDHGDDALLPDSYFVVRNQNGAASLALVSKGSVMLKEIATSLITGTSSAQDNPAGLLRPLDVALNATGLKIANGSFAAGDRLLLFDNAQIGFDKTPSATYFQDAAAPDGPWRREGDNLTDRGAEIIPVGAGFIVRKAATANGQAAFWTNSFPVQATRVVSRKIHGAAGTFDIDLPLVGTPGVECRGTGSDFKVVFTFPGPVSFSGAVVTSGTVSTVSPLATAANEVTVDLNGVADAQRITVTLFDVSDGANTNNVAVRMGILRGDANGNGSVNGSDVSQAKLGAQTGQVTAATFRQDVNVNGTINASDISMIKALSGSALQAP